MEFSGDKVARETQYFPDPFVAPSSRAECATVTADAQQNSWVGTNGKRLRKSGPDERDWIRLALWRRTSPHPASDDGPGNEIAAYACSHQVVGAIAVTPRMRSLLFAVAPNHVMTFAFLCVVIVVAFLTCFIPARRAMKVDALVALRYLAVIDQGGRNENESSITSKSNIDIGNGWREFGNRRIF